MKNKKPSKHIEQTIETVPKNKKTQWRSLPPDKRHKNTMRTSPPKTNGKNKRNKTQTKTPRTNKNTMNFERLRGGRLPLKGCPPPPNL